MHLNSDSRGVRLVVPSVHPNDLGQPVDVECVVPPDAAQGVDRGERLVAKRGLRGGRGGRNAWPIYPG